MSEPVTKPLDENPLVEPAYHMAGHTAVDLHTGRRFPTIDSPRIHTPRTGFMCHDRPGGKKDTLMRMCAGICAQALYRWQIDGGEVAALLPALRQPTVALGAVVHEQTGRSLDDYITQAVRTGGYLDYKQADHHGLGFEDEATHLDDQKDLAGTCDFLVGCWPLVERIALALKTSSSTLAYEDVVGLKDG